MPARKKTYRVVGTQSVEGHPPGEEFTASFDKTQEAFLVGVGALEVVTDTKKDK